MRVITCPFPHTRSRGALIGCESAGDRSSDRVFDEREIGHGRWSMVQDAWIEAPYFAMLEAIRSRARDEHLACARFMCWRSDSPTLAWNSSLNARENAPVSAPWAKLQPRTRRTVGAVEISRRENHRSRELSVPDGSSLIRSVPPNLRTIAWTSATN